MEVSDTNNSDMGLDKSVHGALIVGWITCEFQVESVGFGLHIQLIKTKSVIGFHSLLH